MRTLFRLGLLASALALSACSTLEPEQKIDPPQGSLEAFRLQASGEQIFRCQIDTRGWFWHFETPNAYLFDEKTNQAVAKYGYNFTFAHNDGSRITGKIIASRPNSHRDLSDALFEVAVPANYGTFKDIRYVQRINNKGGIPLTKCTVSRKGQLARIPFTADFIFYR